MSEQGLPKHLDKNDGKVDHSRHAVAPYNFVRLPEQVIPAELPLPDHDRYYDERHTGYIECEIETCSPLFIRGMSEPSKSTEDKNNPDFFYINDQNQPVVPGSSLRGMIRALVEIASFSKIERVDNKDPLLFRAVADPSYDSLKQTYNQINGVIRNGTGGNIKAGFLHYDQAKQKWTIKPAVTSKVFNTTFVQVNAAYVHLGNKVTNFKDKDYQPGFFEVSYDTKPDKQGNTYISAVRNPKSLTNRSFIVLTGNMQETDQSDNAQRSNQSSKSDRSKHWIVFPEDPNAKPVYLNPQAVEDYIWGLSAYQKEMYGDQGILQEGNIIFYIPNGTKDVIYFGHNPNFRTFYWNNEQDRAARIIDFVPPRLRNSNTTDLAEAIFGFVRDKKVSKEQARAGRVFFHDAELLKQEQADGSHKQPSASFMEPLTPHILGSPKPTTFQHYLVQEQQDRSTLKHYGSEPTTETVIRGHKMYWHQGDVDQRTFDVNYDNPDPSTHILPPSSKVHTRINPLKSGARFTFKIDFENLSDVELGALLWVLQIYSKYNSRLKVGMGKPLGLGSIKLTATNPIVQNRKDRYTNLFSNNEWNAGRAKSIDTKDCINRFKEHISPQFDELKRIKELLLMLQWEDHPPRTLTRYQALEEFKHRPILPKPHQIINGELAEEGIDQEPAELEEPVETNEDLQPEDTTIKPRAYYEGIVEEWRPKTKEAKVVLTEPYNGIVVCRVNLKKIAQQLKEGSKVEVQIDSEDIRLGVIDKVLK